ncbi:transposase [Thorsellia anophelis]|uniref:Transposase domain n=1 Tax=Thorsellia anophelis DSM 18579 TaxID=1123402 RepID=A0A1H9ZMZ7_9GAMM|nr:transposase [Thorsellia anophelis]SES83041.1 Transposase domain [Thorsellia anophelis DSM 18579]
MNTTEFNRLMQLNFYVHNSLFPFLLNQDIVLTDKLRELIKAIEISEIDKFVRLKSKGFAGRPPADRIQFARAFIAKAVFNLSTTNQLIERLTYDNTLRVICGFSTTHNLPDKSSFSRAFKEFSEYKLPEITHQSFIKNHLSNVLFESVSHDSTAIESREKAIKKSKEIEGNTNNTTVDEPKKKRGRPSKEALEKKKMMQQIQETPISFIDAQRKKSVAENIQNLPKVAAYSCKKNSKGFKTTWLGYKLHISTAPGDIPISCILTSASVHDSQVMVPLMQETTSKIDYCYDLADAGYCSKSLREASLELGHVPLIDHNPRRADKKEFEAFEAIKYKARSGVERVNAHLKDFHGGRNIWVKGAEKVMTHLMFGVLVITVEQTLRFAT